MFLIFISWDFYESSQLCWWSYVCLRVCKTWSEEKAPGKPWNCCSGWFFQTERLQHPQIWSNRSNYLLFWSIIWHYLVNLMHLRGAQVFISGVQVQFPDVFVLGGASPRGCDERGARRSLRLGVCRPFLALGSRETDWRVAVMGLKRMIDRFIHPPTCSV